MTKIRVLKKDNDKNTCIKKDNDKNTGIKKG